MHAIGGIDIPMRGLQLGCLVAALVVGPAPSTTRESALEVATRFLPSGAELLKLYEFDVKTGRVIDIKPAVLEGHILDPSSNNIVFAYRTEALDLKWHSLFVTLLHKTNGSYVKLYELTYYGKVLMSSSSGSGLKLLRLPPDRREAVAVWTGIGASLGGQLQVFRWDTLSGLVNVMPENGDVRHVSYAEGETGPTVTLSYERTGIENLPPPITYRWDGRAFRKVS